MRVSPVETFEVCVPTRIALRMTLCWLHFVKKLTNRNAELAVLSFLLVNKNVGNQLLLNNRTVIIYNILPAL